MLAQVDRIAKAQGGRALEGFMVLDSASTVFTTNDRRNLLPKTIKTDKIAIDTGNGEMVVQEWDATYVHLFSTNIILFIEKCLVLKKIKILLIIPESYFDVVGCRIVSEGGVRILSHKSKDLIKARLANKLYKAEIKFKIGRGKPQRLIKGDAGVRCQDFFCEVKHHHPLHTLKENPGKLKLWQLKKGQATPHLSFAAGNSTSFC